MSDIYFYKNTVADELSGDISIHAADIDNDGDRDILGSLGFEDQIVWWEYDSSDGSLTEHIATDDFDSVYDLCAEDIDGDGNIDIVAAGEDSFWLSNDSGDGTTWTKNTISTSSALTIYAEDFDGDNDTDIFAANGGIYYYENADGDGDSWNTIQVNDSTTSLDNAEYIAIGDIDGDGNPDAVTADDSSNTGIYWWNNSDGDFSDSESQTVDASIRYVEDLEAEDIDGDGDIDVLASDGVNSSIFWWENTQGDGSSWTEYTIDDDFSRARDVYVEDVDGDNDLDVLGAALDNDEIAWWENTAGDASSWTKHTLDDGFDRAREVHADDIDDDGDIDVLGSGYSESLAWWENGRYIKEGDTFSYDLSGATEDITFTITDDTAEEGVDYWIEDGDGNLLAGSNGTYSTDNDTLVVKAIDDYGYDPIEKDFTLTFDNYDFDGADTFKHTIVDAAPVVSISDYTTTIYETPLDSGDVVSFDGEDDYLEIAVGNGEFGDFAGHDFSVELWFKTTAESGTLIGAGKTSGDFWRVYLEDGLAKFDFDTGGNSSNPAISGEAVNDGEWHHLAAVRNGSKTGKLYIDGVEVDDLSLSKSTTSIDTSTNVTVGKYVSGSNYFEGKIDEVRVWYDDRSADEILDNRYTSLNGDEDDLLAYYTFDEDYVTDSSITDLTDNGNDATLTNGDDDNFVAYPDIIGSIDLELSNQVTSDAGVIVNYQIDSDAIQGTDFYSSQLDISTVDSDDPTNSVYVPAGENSATIYLTALPDAEIEDTEDITVTLLPDYNQALVFDGVDDYLEFADPNVDGVLDAGSEAFTIATWVKPDTLSSSASNHSTQNVFLALASDADNDILEVGISDDGNLLVYLDLVNDDNDAIELGNGELTTDDWHSVAIAFDSGNLTAYLDGNKYTHTYSGTEFDDPDSSPLTLGATLHSDIYYNGAIDHLTVWDIALDDTEDDSTVNIYDALYGSPTETEENLVGYWNFNQSTVDGTTITDASANDNDATLYNFNQALSFDGSDDYIDIPGGNGEFGDFAGSDFSVELWFKTIAESGTLIGAGNTSSDFWQIYLEDGLAKFDFDPGRNSSNPAVSEDVVNDGEWHHLAAVRDGSKTGKLYIDGVEVDTLSHTSSLTSIDTSTDVTIGKYVSGSNYFEGEIDQVRVWDDERSADEIEDNLDTFLDGDEDNLIAYYGFDDGDATDSSNSGNDGSVSGATDVDSDNLDFNLSTSIAYDPFSTGGATYGIEENQSVTISLEDNTAYSAGIAIADEYGEEVSDSNTILLDEDSNANFSLKLTSEPTDTVTVDFGSLGSYDFDASNWDTTQDVSLQIDSDLTFSISSNDSNYNFDGTLYVTDSSDEVKLKVTEGGTELEETILPTVEITETTDAYPDEDTAGEVTVALDETAEADLTIPFGVDATTTTDVTSDSLENLISLETAAYFDGEDDYIAIADSTDLDLSDEVTIEAYIKVDSFGKAWQTIVSKGDGWQLSRNDETDHLYFGYGDSVGVSGSTDIADGEWHHVAGVYNGSQLLVYVDGELDGSELESISYTANDYNLQIGANEAESDRNFHGQIDEVRLWNTSRSQAELQDGMVQSLEGSETGLLGYWTFDDATVSDLTDNGYDGSLSNGDASTDSNFVDSYFHKGTLNIAQGEDAAVIAITGTESDLEDDRSATVTLQSGDDYDLDLNEDTASIAIDYEQPGVELGKRVTVGSFDLGDGGDELLDLELALLTETDSDIYLATINLALAAEITGDEEVTVTFDDSDNTSVTFDADNWDETQQITISSNLEHTVSISSTDTDSAYNNQIDLDISATELEISFDTSDVSVVTTEDGDSDEFAVLLESEPSDDVFLFLEIGDTTEGVFADSNDTIQALKFTPDDWNEYQTVEITGVDDSEYDGDSSYSIEVSAYSDDDDYNGLTDYVEITNEDNETEVDPDITVDDRSTSENGIYAGLSFNNDEVAEGATGSFTISLTDASGAAASFDEETIVNYEIHGGSATSEDDFAPITDQVAIAAGESSVTIDLETYDDDIDEDDETVQLKLVSPGHDLEVTTAYDSDTGTIWLQLDDDDNKGSFDLEAGDELFFSNGSNVIIEEAVTILESEPTEVSITIESGNEIEVGETSRVYEDNYQLDNDVAEINDTLTLTDDDTADILITADEEGTTALTSLETSEESGTSDTFYVQLTSQPTDNVLVYFGSTDTDEGLLSDSDETFEDTVKLLFTPSNWDTPQAVSLKSVDDDEDDGDTEYQILSHVISDDLKYNDDNLPLLVDADFDASSDDTIDLLIDDLSVSETVLSAGTQLNFANGMTLEVNSDTTLSNAEVTSVSVTTVETANQILTDTTASIDHDGDNLTENVTLVVTEDYEDGTIGLQIDEDSTVDSITLAAEEQLTFSNGAVVTIEEEITLNNTDSSEVSVTLDANLLQIAVTEITVDTTADVPIDSSDANSKDAEIIVTTAYDGTEKTIGLQVNDDSVDSISLEAGTKISFSNGAEVILTNDITLSNSEATSVDVNPIDNEIATYFTESLTEDLTITNTDNDTAGVTITASDTSTTEGYGNNFFSVSLDSQPTEEVSVTFNPSNDDIQLADEFDGESYTLTFDADNWSIPQNVNVTAVDDFDVEYDHSSTISVNVTSDDADYDGINPTPNEIEIFIEDNDLPIASIEAIANAAEAGAPGYFVITLDEPAPSGFDGTGIEVSYSIDDGSTADVNDDDDETDDVQPITGSVRIAPGQTQSQIIAFPIDDFKVEGETTGFSEEIVIVNLSAGDDYQISNDAASATLSIQDNDRAGIRIIEVGDRTVVNEAGTSEFYVSLLSQPEADVTITLNNADTEKGLVVESVDTDNNTVDLTLDPDGEISSLFLEVDAELTLGDTTYTVTTSDSDVTGYVITDEATTVTLSESVSSSLVNETLTYSYPEIGFGDDATNSTSLTFNASNWYELQTVTVAGIDDNVVEAVDYHTSDITYTVSSDDTNYDEFDVSPQTVDIVDRSFDSDEVTESLTEGFYALQDGIDSISIPILGSLDGVAPSFIEDFIDDLIDEIKAADEVTAETITDAFEVALGVEDIVEITDLSSNNIEFLVSFDDSQTTDIAIDGDLGLSSLGIGLETNGSIEASFDYGIDLAFGINTEDGFYLNTDDTSFNVEAGLAFADLGDDSVIATGNLGFLQLDVSDGDNGGTGIGAEFVVTLEDTETDDDEAGQLTLSELTEARDNDNLFDFIQYGFSGDATLDLGIETTIDGDTSFPSFGFDLYSDLPLFNYSNANDDEDLSGATVILDNDLDRSDLSTTDAAEISVTISSDDSDGIRLNKGTELTFKNSSDEELVSVILDKSYTFSEGDSQDIEVTLAEDDNNTETTIDAGSEADLVSGDFSLEFNNIELDLGDFITDLMSPVIEFAEELIEPFEPIIEVLETEVELIDTLGLTSDFDENDDGEVSLLEVASMLAIAFSGGENTLDYAEFFDAVSGIIDLVDTVETLKTDIVDNDENLTIEFGNYILSNFNAASDSEDISTYDTEDNGDSSGLSDDTSDQITHEDDGSSFFDTLTSFFDTLDELGISIPIVEDPFTAINLLLGQDVDLVTYDVPELNIEFDIEQEFPIFGSITGLLEGGFSIYSDLVLGFDTYGISEWADDDFEFEDSYKILDGFYISDIDPDTGEDVDELTLDATIAAGVEASAVVASASVTGGITGTAALDIVDDGEYTGDSDGKLRGSEISSDITSVLSLSGSLEAFLEATVKVGIDMGFFEIMKTVWSEEFSVTLFEFELENSSGTSSQAYLEGSTVFFDSNLNGIHEEGEPMAVTNSDGTYHIDIPLLFFDTDDNGILDPEEGRMVNTGGTDTSSGLTIETPLVAPYGASMITPLTTLKQKLIEAGFDSDAAEAQIELALGLPDIDLEHFDLIAAIADGDSRGAEVYQAHVTIQTIFVQTTKFIQEFDTHFNPDMPLAEEVISAIAQGIIESGNEVELYNVEHLRHIVVDVLSDNMNHDTDHPIDSEALTETLDAFAETLAKSIDYVDAAFANADLETLIEDIAPVKQLVQGDLSDLQSQLGSGEITYQELLTQLDEILPSDVTSDRIFGTGDGDLLLGQDEHDGILGDNGHDFVWGSDGSDSISGGEGNDFLVGDDDDDLINGRMGDDILFGESGADTLIGGEGNDILIGGEDSDIFGISMDSGQDMVMDFVDGVDKIGLIYGLSYETLNIVSSDAQTTFIQDENNQTLAVLGVNADSISKDDFVTEF